MDSHSIHCEKRHTNDPVQENSWTEIQERDPVGRDTLSGEHLIGTAAGVMRSRAVRRLQEPARWVPAALNAMLFTPWSPHLNLLGRHRLQRPAYEEPIEIPTAPTTNNPKSETFVTKPGDAEQSKKRQRQEVTFQEPQQTSSSPRYSRRHVNANS